MSVEAGMVSGTATTAMSEPVQKLHGRAFYESIGSPKFVVAPMVDQSEFAWRLLTRSFMTPESSKQLLAYSPMLHSRMFHETPKYRASNFEALKTPLPSPLDVPATPNSASDLYLDGNPAIDRPLFVQFCTNTPTDFLSAARYVAPFCDAVDLNLGCPQGIAKRGKYGAFLQEDWDLIFSLINTLHKELPVPVTAKIRIQSSREKTLEYAKMVLRAGASILTVHGRQREQKGHNTGLADWSMIRYLRENLPPETVIFANGNILQHEDIEDCLRETGADAVMSAEGNLYDPSIFAEPPPVGQEGREYWRGRDGKGGYRMDASLRRYMDILYKHVLQQEPPARKPLFIPSDPVEPESVQPATNGHDQHASATTTTPAATAPTQEFAHPVPTKKRKRAEMKEQSKGQKKPKLDGPISVNLRVVQAHLFHMLRPLVAKHTHIRDALARCRAGDIAAFENVLQLTEQAVKQGLIDYANGFDDGMLEEKPKKKNGETNGDAKTNGTTSEGEQKLAEAEADVTLSSTAAVLRCRRPWWIMQPYVRPLPQEAFEIGAMTLSKKEKERLAKENSMTKEAGLQPEGRVEEQAVGSGDAVNGTAANGGGEKEEPKVVLARDGLVCG